MIIPSSRVKKKIQAALSIEHKGCSSTTPHSPNAESAFCCRWSIYLECAPSVCLRFACFPCDTYSRCRCFKILTLNHLLSSFAEIFLVRALSALRHNYYIIDVIIINYTAKKDCKGFEFRQEIVK